VQVPPNQQAVAVGDLEGVDRADEAWTYRYATTRPVEGMSVYTGFYKQTEGLAGAVALAAYTEPGREEEAPLYLAEAARVLDFYGDHFGRYPHHKLALVETDFPGGYGATSAVALPHAAFDRQAVADEFLAHEIAHNWTDLIAYKGTLGEKGFMAEGVASYLDLLYHAGRDGAAGFRRRLPEAHKRYAAVMGSQQDLPIADADQDNRTLWQVLTYDKASLVLHMLRREIGDKAFDQGLRSLYAQHAGQEVGLEDFEAAFDKASGQHLGYFFRQWLTRPSVPVVAAEGLHVKALGGGKYELDGVLAQKTLPFVLTVPLVVVSDKGERVYQVPVKSFNTPFKLRVPGKPRVLLIDPLRDALLVGSPPALLR
jgi:aminopeptidase N